MQLHIGFTAVLSVFLMALPLAGAFFSAGLITISLFAKSYKEAQSYVSPLMVLVDYPAVAAMLPGVELNRQAGADSDPECQPALQGAGQREPINWNFIALIFSFHLRFTPPPRFSWP